MPKGNPKPSEVERIISNSKLKMLLKEAKVAESRMAEERGAMANKLKAAQEADNLDMIAFGLCKRLGKMSEAKAAITRRNIELYLDMAEIGTQLDIEDALAKVKAEEDQRSDVEKVIDGDLSVTEANARKATTDNVLRNSDLHKFEDAMREAQNVKAVNVGLDRFTIDHPHMADAALELAQERLRQLAAEQGGGEDVRPRHLREAENVTTGKARRKKEPGMTNGDEYNDAG